MEETTERGRRRRLQHDGRLPPLMSLLAAERAAVRESTSRASASSRNKQQRSELTGAPPAGGAAEGLQSLLRAGCICCNFHLHSIHPGSGERPCLRCYRGRGACREPSPVTLTFTPQLRDSAQQQRCQQAERQSGCSPSAGGRIQSCQLTSERHLCTFLPPPPVPRPPLTSLIK